MFEWLYMYVQSNLKTSIARISLGPRKFVRDMGNYQGLIIAAGQGANGDNLEKSFLSGTKQ